MKQRLEHLPMGLAAMSCSPTARTASASAAAWLALLPIRCCDTTDRSSSAVWRAAACDPSTFLPANTDTQRHKHTRATAIESDREGRGEAAAYRRLSLRTKSLTSGCTSGMAESAVGTPGDGGGIRSELGRIGSERRLRGVRVFRQGRGAELTLKKPRHFTNLELGPRDTLGHFCVGTKEYIWGKK